MFLILILTHYEIKCFVSRFRRVHFETVWKNLDILEAGAVDFAVGNQCAKWVSMTDEDK